MNKVQSKGGHTAKVITKQNPLQGDRQESNRAFDSIGLGIVILLGLFIYSNSFECSFHFDDAQNIVNNPKIKNLDLKALWNFSHTRFVPYLTFAINYQFDKLNVSGYHIINLVIHLLNSCLVWWLTILIFSTPYIRSHSIVKHKRNIAILTTLFFVSHPLATQSVTYIVQRMTSIAAMFYLLSLAFYVKARLTDKESKLRYLLFSFSIISALLAMLSKENAFTLPAAMILIELCFLQIKLREINSRNYRAMILVAAFLVGIAAVIIKYPFGVFKTLPPDYYNDFRTMSSMHYLFTQFGVIVKYIQLLFLPINQNVDYDFQMANSFFELRTFLCFIFLASLISLAVFLINRNRIISFGIFWFFLTLSVESSLVPISDLIFEHRTYLPSFGFFLILSSGINLLL